MTLVFIGLICFQKYLTSEPVSPPSPPLTTITHLGNVIYKILLPLSCQFALVSYSPQQFGSDFSDLKIILCELVQSTAPILEGLELNACMKE